MSWFDFRRLQFRCILTIAGASGLGSNAMAQAPSAPPLWELGGGVLGTSQQAYPGSDERVNRALPLPFFIYRGDVLRADRDSTGIRALKTKTFEVDIGFAGSLGAGSGSLEARSGMADLGTLVELGPRLKWALGAVPGGGRLRAEAQVRAVFDLNDSAYHRGFSFEPRLVHELQTDSGWRHITSASVIFADTRLARTFYEVRPGEATAGRPAYSADSGLLAWRFSTSLSRRLNRDWSVFGFARLDTVAGAANESSPLVRQTTGATVGLGFAYTWKRSDGRGAE